MTAQPYAAAMDMLKKNCASGNYMDKWNKYAGRDIIQPLRLPSYSSSFSSNGIDYKLDMGLS